MMGKGESKGLSVALARMQATVKRELGEMGLEYEERRYNDGPWDTRKPDCQKVKDKLTNQEALELFLGEDLANDIMEKCLRLLNEEEEKAVRFKPAECAYCGRNFRGVVIVNNCPFCGAPRS